MNVIFSNTDVDASGAAARKNETTKIKTGTELITANELFR